LKEQTFPKTFLIKFSSDSKRSICTLQEEKDGNGKGRDKEVVRVKGQL